MNGLDVAYPQNHTLHSQHLSDEGLGWVALVVVDNFECLYVMFTKHHICVILQSSAHHIGGWICPTLMHKFNST